MRVRTLCAAVAAAVAAAALTGCSAALTAPGSAPAASADARGVVTVVLADVSGSTRDRAGQYAGWCRDAARWTAERRGTLWAAPATGATVTDGAWTIAGHAFAPRLGSDELAAGELREQARVLDGACARTVLPAAGRTSGSDSIAGSSVVAARTFAGSAGARRVAVFIGDGALTAPVDLTAYATLDSLRIERLIARLRAQGRVPDLRGGHGARVEVVLAGVGIGVHRPDPVGLIAFWRAYVQAAGGRIVAEDSVLRMPA